MATKALPSPKVLRQLLRYEPETGKLFWLPRDDKWFPHSKYRTSAGDAANWNARYAGREAFPRVDRNGYRHGRILNVRYMAHRVAWAIHFGGPPKHSIDHINGDRADNRISNLRDVPHLENMRNTRMPQSNASGVVGVYFRKREGKWCAKIGGSKNQLFLGRFQTMEEAIAARKSAESGLGYHLNHGTPR